MIMWMPGGWNKMPSYKTVRLCIIGGMGVTALVGVCRFGFGATPRIRRDLGPLAIDG